MYAMIMKMIGVSNTYYIIPCYVPTAPLLSSSAKHASGKPYVPTEYSQVLGGRVNWLLNWLLDWLAGPSYSYS